MQPLTLAHCWTPRIAPPASDKERFGRIAKQMDAVKAVTLSEFQGGKAKPIDDIEFPPVGERDADVFENDLLEVMQFVFNHTTFDVDNAEDQAVLAAYKPLGVEPGKAYDPDKVARIDGKQIREVAQNIQRDWLRDISSQEIYDAVAPVIFQPKGETSLDALVATSITGPIGIPQEEAVYPQLVTTDGAPLNAQHDYVIRMSKDEMPPANAFWSLTLYDEHGFLVESPIGRYTIGDRDELQYNGDGSLEILIQNEAPQRGLSNWLPAPAGPFSLTLRVYSPREDFLDGSWKLPAVQRLD